MGPTHIPLVSTIFYAPFVLASRTTNEPSYLEVNFSQLL